MSKTLREIFTGKSELELTQEDYYKDAILHMKREPWRNLSFMVMGSLLTFGLSQFDTNQKEQQELRLKIESNSGAIDTLNISLSELRVLLGRKERIDTIKAN